MYYFFITLRSCRGAAHATSRRVVLHHAASGTLLLYKQRRSSVLSLGSHSSTRVTSKHGQPTCLHRRVYGEVNDDTWIRAALVERHGDRHGTETRSTGGRITAWWSAARHGDPHHWLIAARHGVLHGTAQHRCTAQFPKLDVITGRLVDVWRTTRDSARYSFGTILFCTVSRTVQDCGTGHCIAPVVPHWGTAHKLYLHSINCYELRLSGTVHCCNCCNCLTALLNTYDG